LSSKISFLCNACGKNLEIEKVSEFIKCNRCGSYSLFTHTKAEFDNREYFNTIYDTISKLKRSSLRDSIYSLFSRLDYKINKLNEINIDSYFENSKQSCEIGFGLGNHLLNRLNAGINIQGIDISHTCVEQFQNKFAQFKDNVSCNTDIPSDCDLVYSDALLEHIDSPYDFLKNINHKISKKGFIIMRFPFIPDQISDSCEDNDINFWKPCHRTILNSKGVEILFERTGFKVVSKNTYNNYAYRLLNLYLKAGFNKVHQHRNTNMVSADHPNLITFLKLLTQAIFTKNRSIEILVIATNS
jgi:DNA-directed RNA polymerase subunit RPC12/RpoP